MGGGREDGTEEGLGEGGRENGREEVQGGEEGAYIIFLTFSIHVNRTYDKSRWLGYWIRK